MSSTTAATPSDVGPSHAAAPSALAGLDLDAEDSATLQEALALSVGSSSIDSPLRGPAGGDLMASALEKATTSVPGAANELGLGASDQHIHGGVSPDVSSAQQQQLDPPQVAERVPASDMAAQTPAGPGNPGVNPVLQRTAPDASQAAAMDAGGMPGTSSNSHMQQSSARASQHSFVPADADALAASAGAAPALNSDRMNPNGNVSQPAELPLAPMMNVNINESELAPGGSTQSNQPSASTRPHSQQPAATPSSSQQDEHSVTLGTNPTTDFPGQSCSTVGSLALGGGRGSSKTEATAAPSDGMHASGSGGDGALLSGPSSPGETTSSLQDPGRSLHAPDGLLSTAAAAASSQMEGMGCFMNRLYDSWWLICATL